MSLLLLSFQKRQKSGREMAMSLSYATGASALLECGIGVVPFSGTALVQLSFEGFEKFLGKYPTQEVRQCHGIDVAGEPDLGYIGRNGGQHDHKDTFHYSPRVPSILKSRGLMSDEEDQALLATWDALYRHCHDTARAVLAALGELGEGYLLEAFDEVTADPTPRAEHILRITRYRAGAAQVHRDRSLITVHAGDRGGELYGVRQGDKIPCSPKAKEATTFFGVKVAILSRWAFLPLRHGSDGCTDGEDRMAVVFFGHAKTTPPVGDANDVILHSQRWG